MTKIVTLKIFLMFSFIAYSCVTIDTSVPPGAMPEVYFYKAQVAIDNFDDDTALTIYQRFLDTDPQDQGYRLSAKYEIALIHLKKDRKELAKKGFQEILQTYHDLEQTNSLPGWVLVLTEKKLSQLKKD